jgi:hypothetical protein
MHPSIWPSIHPVIHPSINHPFIYLSILSICHVCWVSTVS